MSDNSIPLPPAEDPSLTPPPALPQNYPPAPPHTPQSVQPTQTYPGAAPSYPPAPQAYPGATPNYPAPQPGTAAQPGYGAQPPGGYAAYGTPSYPSYPAPRPTSGLAITSLVCGLAGLLLSWLFVPMLASVAAVVTGHMALGQTKRNPGIGGRGMAFAGLILGYVVIAFLALTIALSLISVLFFGVFSLPFIINS